MAKQLSYNEALSYAAKFCSTSEKCKFDVKKKLIDRNIDFPDIEKILSFLEEQNYIDENRYAEFFVRDKFRFNKWGKVKISAELQKKQITESFILNATQQIPNNEYIKTAKELLYKKTLSINETDKYKKKLKLMRFMASRGFEQEVIMSLLD